MYISWVGLRGTNSHRFRNVSVTGRDMIFNIVFFISLTSIVIQGTTLPVIARWLHVSLPEKVKPRSEVEMALLQKPKSLLREIRITSEDFCKGEKDC